MGEPNKVYISDTIGGQNTSTATRGSRGTYQVQRTYYRGPRIHGIRRRIVGRLYSSLDGRYIGPGNHYMETIM